MKLTAFLFSLFLSLQLNAQSVTGKWETFDDKTGKKTSLIEIYQKGDKYFGRILELYDKPKSETCTKCEGEKKNKPIVGLVIIENLKKDGTEYNDGTVVDPESGDVYDCYIELVSADKLKIRGYMGFSVLGRTQYWSRKR